MGLYANVACCALVLEGGGMRCSYTAGMVDVLLEQGIHFPLVCGVSAGSTLAVNYLSRDRARSRAFFCDLAAETKAGGARSLLRGRGYLDGAYLYEEAPADGVVPLDFETFVANPAELRMQGFARDSGETLVWGKRDCESPEALLKRIRAGSTLPLLMRPTEVDGEVVFDGGLGHGAGIPVCLAEEAGFDRFLFLATHPEGYVRPEVTAARRAVLGRLLAPWPHVLDAILTRPERYRKEMARVEELEEAGRCLIMWPDTMSVSSTCRDVAALERSFAAGRAQALRELPRLRMFLFGDPLAGPRTTTPPRHATCGGPGYVTIEQQGG